MLPIKDNNPSPVTPWVVYGLLGLNTAVFLLEVSLPSETLERVVNSYGLVPARAGAALSGEASILTGLLFPAIASMFIHGGWAHLIGNMWYLYIFGDNVEGRLGHGPFVLFYLSCGLLASVAHCLLTTHSTIPTVIANAPIHPSTAQGAAYN